VIDVLTAEDVRRIDADCEARGITTQTLMGNAGYAVADAARRLLDGSYGRRIVILCGKGNNAGDGLVAGQVLASRGASIAAVLTLGEEFTGAAAQAWERFPGRQLNVGDVERELARADLVVDALFGVGLSRAIEGDAARAIELTGASGVPVLAIDVPSGVDSDTGRVLGVAARAIATVTLDGLKPGLMFEPGRSHAGYVEVADIGVPSDLKGARTRSLDVGDVRALLPRRAASSHKRNAGTVLAVVGSRGLPGAAALVAGAAVHAGAGLTIVAAPESAVPTIVARVPEATAIAMPETGDGTIDPKGIELIIQRLKEFHVAALGPGLSTHPATAEVVRSLVTELQIPLVLDADALTALAGADELIASRTAPTVLTPHARELSRLTGQSVEEIEADRLAAARGAAARFDCVVLLKGPGTVIAAPDGRAFVTATGGASLAQGGTGDVLTGLTAALLAQAGRLGGETDPLLVTAIAAWIHGHAGDLLAERVGPHPASASMLIETLPEVLHEVAG
jgi:ADP-dependent NAD(P)H-hydrate dehydratase / NAD(P)H-hydrate epimerase